jgi:MoaA/NifB/PqqE/SkfB family radical SAM enzyme
MSSRIFNLTRGFLNRTTPGYLIFFVTPYCDCRCSMCFNWKVIEQAASRNVLKFEEIEKIARNFPGLHHVNFSGGEPFLRKDFSSIPELFYRHSGTRIFACPTNSSRPDTIAWSVERICASCPDAWIRITQSLDGIGEDHDNIRHKPGLFENVIRLNHDLARLRKKYSNLTTGVTTVMSKFNEGKEHQIADYVYKNLLFDDFGVLYARGDTSDPEARNVNCGDYELFVEECRKRAQSRKIERSWTGLLFSAINAASLDLLTRSIRNDSFVTYCRAGKNMVVMDDEGAISPCEILEHYIQTGRARLDTSVFGNIRDYNYDIREILNTDQARTIINYIRKSRCYCSFECAMTVNVLYSPQLWPRILRNLWKT